MFGTLGGPELLLILVIALIVFGPSKLPEMGKSIGKMLVEFRRASNDFKRTIEDEVEAEKVRTAVEPPRFEPAPAASAGTAAPAAAPWAAPPAPASPPDGATADAAPLGVPQEAPAAPEAGDAATPPGAGDAPAPLVAGDAPTRPTVDREPSPAPAGASTGAQGAK